MPIFDFMCACGHLEKDVEQGIHDEHTMVCYCGRTMQQDFGDYKPPMVFGELPTRGCWNGYYDPNLGAKIHSKKQRDDLMRAKGLTEFHMEPDQARMHEEVKYIQKNAKGGETRRAINKMADKLAKEKSEAVTASIIDPIVDRTLASLS